MDIDRLIDDIVIWKRRELTYSEREEIISELMRLQDDIIPSEQHKMNNNMLHEASDFDLVWILMHGYETEAVRYFSHGKKVYYFPNEFE